MDRWSRPSCRGSLLNDGVEDADFLPILFVLRDELLMRRGRLVFVMGGLILEDDVQGHVEISIIHLAAQLLSQDSAGEGHGPGVAGQVFLASGQ